MATIVYEGALGGGGNLFEGKKFWVSVKVPQRDRWVSGIENNGGTVVKLEKQADLMIADHAKRDAPNGSYSWKYIEAALKEGKLPDLDDHLIRPKSHIRTLGVSASGKTTRTPFTDADDKVLFRWVIGAEKRGVSLKGNELYKDLERMNSRHTYQSWRDRWIKVLSNRPRPELEPEDEQVDSPASVSPPAHQQVRLRQASSTLKSGIKSRASRPKGVPRASTPILHAQTPRNPVTKEDLQDLFDNYEAILDLDDAKEDDAWNALSTAFPQHTAEEWKEIWIKDVKPIRERKPTSGNERGAAAKNTTSSIFSQFSQVSQTDTEGSQRTSLPPRSTAQQASTRIPSQGNSTTIVKSRSSQAVQPMPRGSRRSSMPSRPSKSTAQRSTSLISQELVEDVAKSSQSLPEPWISPEPPEIRNPSLEDRVKFERCFRLFSQENDVDIELSPVVEGRETTLYELYMYVKARGGSVTVTNQHLWPQIATQMGFDIFRELNAWTELKTIFNDYLMHFEDFRSEIQDKWEPEQRSTLVTNGGMEMEDDEDQDDLDAPYALSRASKRRLSPEQREAYSSQSQVKRRRLYKSKGVSRDEIPSTPEAKFKRPVLYENVSPLKQGQATALDEAEDGDEEGMFVGPVERNIFGKNNRNVTQDPETQDFGYPNLDVNSEDVYYPLLNLNDDDEITNYPRSPERPGSNASQLFDMEDDPEVIKYRDYYISLGYTQEAVDGAMRITTMDLDLMPGIMEHLDACEERGEEAIIPDDIRGVWTEEDDQDILERRSFQRIVEKHTVERVDMRERFLKDMGLLMPVE